MKTLFKNMISNAYIRKGSEVSASGFIGSLIVLIALTLMFILTLAFLFFKEHSQMIYKLIETYLTVLIIGSSLLGLRRLSSLLPNNKVATRLDNLNQDEEENENE